MRLRKSSKYNARSLLDLQLKKIKQEKRKGAKKVSMLNFVSVIMVLCLIFASRRFMLNYSGVNGCLCTYILLKFIHTV